MKKRLIALCLVAVLAGSLAGCGKSTDKYSETLKSGVEKYDNGEAMTKEEYNAVKNLKDWESKQGEKTYDQWDSGN